MTAFTLVEVAAEEIGVTDGAAVLEMFEALRDGPELEGEALRARLTALKETAQPLADRLTALKETMQPLAEHVHDAGSESDPDEVPDDVFIETLRAAGIPVRGQKESTLDEGEARRYQRAAAEDLRRLRV